MVSVVGLTRALPPARVEVQVGVLTAEVRDLGRVLVGELARAAALERRRHLDLVERGLGLGLRLRHRLCVRRIALAHGVVDEHARAHALGLDGGRRALVLGLAAITRRVEHLQRAVEVAALREHNVAELGHASLERARVLGQRFARRGLRDDLRAQQLRGGLRGAGKDGAAEAAAGRGGEREGEGGRG